MGEENKQEPADPTEGYQKLLAKHNNDAMAVSAFLYQDNYQARERNRQLQAELDTAKTRIPAEGTAVIAADRAKLLEAYEAIGKPEDLGKLQGELTGMRKAQLLTQAAQAHGYKQSVLSQLAKDAAIEMREIEKDGKKAQAAFVLEDGGKATILSDYATAHWADFMPALADAQPERKIQPGNGSDPKPANQAGAGVGAEKQAAAFGRSIHNLF